MTYLNYLAYGSNLHPLRLSQRISSCELLGKITLSEYILSFHKRGACGSGKCNLVYTADKSDIAHAAIYRIHTNDKPVLDEYEGEGYTTKSISIDLDGQTILTYAYLAEQDFIDDSLQPYHWYKDIVYQGGLYHNLPSSYLKRIQRVDSCDDNDLERTRVHQQLIADMQSLK